MNINTILSRLRRNNKSQYLLYFLSSTFAFAVISAYALLIFSPTVLEVLPVGGDSRKQAFGIFAVVCVGCMAFSFYASGLFFKKKQTEIGIMMALGGNRTKLFGVIAKENLLIQVVALVAGILLAAPINQILWGILHLFVNNNEMILRMDAQVIGVSVIFGLIIIAISFFALRKVVFSMELMDVVKSEHKNEMVKKPGKHIGLLGVILTVFGAIGGYYSSSVYMAVFSAYPPEWLNLIFIIPLVGIYLILLHVVVNGGGAKKNKYKHMISKSMMIFQGRQTVNCMLVLTLLIGGGCFAGFYVPVMMSALGVSVSERAWNYQYEMPETIEDFRAEDLEQIILSKDGIIREKMELPMLLVACDGQREIQEGKKFYHVYDEIYRTVEFIRESDYEAFTGTTLSMPDDAYYAIGNAEGLGRYDMDQDIQILTNMTTRKQSHVKCAGVLACEDLYRNTHTTYVASDALYEELSAGLGSEWRNTLYYMKVDNDSYDTAVAVYDAFVKYFPMEYRIDSGYDRISKISQNEAGMDYWFDNPQYEDMRYLKENNAEFERDWEYYPMFLSMVVTKSIQNYSVFFMLFIYVTIVALVAFWLISYTRCMT
ncbi:MAG: ABC transporter permease, partial [bacterium]|nr:ABC transporter permease [bacterium]